MWLCLSRVTLYQFHWVVFDASRVALPPSPGVDGGIAVTSIHKRRCGDTMGLLEGGSDAEDPQSSSPRLYPHPAHGSALPVTSQGAVWPLPPVPSGALTLCFLV